MNGDSPECPHTVLPRIPRWRPLEANLRISPGQATYPAKTSFEPDRIAGRIALVHDLECLVHS